MRKVRVWDDVLNEMLYGRVEQFDDMLGFRFEKHLETENPIYMWETGLRDKNGKEIYEGDILDVDGTPWLVEPIGTEERDGGKFGLCASPYGSGEAYFIDKSILDGKVIGNIWDNPELLKGDENE